MNVQICQRLVTPSKGRGVEERLTGQKPGEDSKNERCAEKLENTQKRIPAAKGETSFGWHYRVESGDLRWRSND